jgi:hypothetical protein
VNELMKKDRAYNSRSRPLVAKVQVA